MRKNSAVAWFRQTWLVVAKRFTVLAQYRAIGNYAMADIALRGFVYSDFPDAKGDVFAAGIAVGRRQLALEILELKRADPNVLFELIEVKPAKQELRR